MSQSQFKGISLEKDHSPTKKAHKTKNRTPESQGGWEWRNKERKGGRGGKEGGETEDKRGGVLDFKSEMGSLQVIEEERYVAGT